MKKYFTSNFLIFVFSLLLFSTIGYSQQFNRLSNIENLFNLSKKQIDSTLLANGYILKSKDLKTKILTYKKSVSNNNYNYTVNVLYKGDKLNSFLWDDYTEFAYFIIKDSSNDYKFNNDKTNDELGIFYVESKELDLDLMIFKTIANTQKGKIAFRIFKSERPSNPKSKQEKTPKNHEQEIKSKTYDLKENNVSLYNENYNEIISKILDYLQELPISSRYSRTSKPYDYYGDTNIQTFRILAKSKENKYRFKNTYTAYYILKDNSRPSENLGSTIVAGSYDVNQKGKITLDSGTDNSCSLFNHISFRIPTIKVQEYEVMTEATFPNISVDYAKGITIIKIKSDEINFADFAPDDDIQDKLKEKLKSQLEGKYVVKYEVGNIAGKEFVNIEIEK